MRAIIQPQPKTLLEYKRITHTVFTAYNMSNHGMDKYANEINKLDGFNPDGVFQIGTSGEKREALSQMGNDDAIEAMQKNGAFSQIIAFGLIVFNFAMWEEEYRQKIADELKMSKADILCDVMGDLRIFRNWIVHNNGIANKDVSKLTCMNWYKKGDAIIITTDEMSKIQKCINTMHVYLK